MEQCVNANGVRVLPIFFCVSLLTKSTNKKEQALNYYYKQSMTYLSLNAFTGNLFFYHYFKYFSTLHSPLMQLSHAYFYGIIMISTISHIIKRLLLICHKCLCFERRVFNKPFLPKHTTFSFEAFCKLTCFAK